MASECAGKIAYADIRDAKRAASATSLKVYKCRVCTAWHIGIPSARSRNQMREKSD